MVGSETKESVTGKIRLVEVIVNYLQDDTVGAVSVVDDDYESGRDRAFALVPEGAQRLSIYVNR